jgi:general secretion pathway protein I
MAPAKGFTLVEVLVALVILAVALTAMIKTASETTVNTAVMRDKFFASLVATNKINELHIQKLWPSTGDSNGMEEMGNQSWFWQMKVDTTPEPTLRKVIVNISSESNKDRVLYSLIAYVGQH